MPALICYGNLLVSVLLFLFVCLCVCATNIVIVVWNGAFLSIPYVIIVVYLNIFLKNMMTR